MSPSSVAGCLCPKRYIRDCLLDTVLAPGLGWGWLHTRWRYSSFSGRVAGEGGSDRDAERQVHRRVAAVLTFLRDASLHSPG